MEKTWFGARGPAEPDLANVHCNGKAGRRNADAALFGRASFGSRILWLRTSPVFSEDLRLAQCIKNQLRGRVPSQFPAAGRWPPFQSGAGRPKLAARGADGPKFPAGTDPPILASCNSRPLQEGSSKLNMKWRDPLRTPIFQGIESPMLTLKGHAGAVGNQPPRWIDF